MKRCVQYELGALDALNSRALAELEAHADGCSDCTASRTRHRAYDGVVSRARAAAAAQEDLEPLAWVRIREGVDAGARGGRRWAMAWPVALAAVAALAVAMLWLGPAENGSKNPVPTDGIAGFDAPRQAPQAPPNSVTAAAREAAPADELYAPGTRIESTDEARMMVAYGRHILTLAPRSVIDVISWSSDAMVLEVRRGSLECDVARASVDELFEVRSGQTQVRVLGTRFTVAAQSDGATGVAVAHGMVEVTHPSGTARLAAGQSERFGGAPAQDAATEQVEADEASESAPARGARSHEPRNRRGDPTKLIDIKVPDQRMDVPVKAMPSNQRRAEPKGDDMKLIEIVVPPQTGPGQ